MSSPRSPIYWHWDVKFTNEHSDRSVTTCRQRIQLRTDDRQARRWYVIEFLFLDQRLIIRRADNIPSLVAGLSMCEGYRSYYGMHYYKLREVQEQHETHIAKK